MSISYTSKVVKGTAWASIDRFGTMGFQFIINLVLARLLCPADFGTVGLLYIFINVSQVLVDSGFASALIQKKEPTQIDYSTIFLWNIIVSVALYIVLYMSAPYIAEFYRVDKLNVILRVLGLSLIVNAFLTIQQNRLTKQLEFRKLALIHLSSYVLSATISINLALYEFGVWSIVAYQLSQAIFVAFFLWLSTKWLPSFVFSVHSFKRLFRFGGYLLASNLMQTVGQNIQGIIIGRKFSTVQMGYYSQAQKLGTISCNSLPAILVAVMYPVYSSMQDDLKLLSSTIQQNLRVIAFIVFPVLCLLIIISEPLIQLLFGSEWMPVVPYFRILCVGGIFTCIHNILYYAIAAVGKSRELFFWGIIKWAVIIVLLFIGMHFGMDGLLWSMTCGEFVIFIINAYLTSRFCGVSMLLLLNIVFRYAGYVLLISMPILFLAKYTDLHPFVSGGIFVILYYITSALMKLQAFSAASNLLQKVRKK